MAQRIIHIDLLANKLSLRTGTALRLADPEDDADRAMIQEARQLLTTVLRRPPPHWRTAGLGELLEGGDL